MVGAFSTSAKLAPAHLKTSTIFNYLVLAPKKKDWLLGGPKSLAFLWQCSKRCVFFFGGEAPWFLLAQLPSLARLAARQQSKFVSCLPDNFSSVSWCFTTHQKSYRKIIFHTSIFGPRLPFREIWHTQHQVCLANWWHFGFLYSRSSSSIDF